MFPRFLVLEVAIAELRVLHGRPESVLLLELVHLAHVLVDDVSQVTQKDVVAFSSRDSVGRDDTTEGVAQEG